MAGAPFKVVIIAGPTAVGKTSALLQIQKTFAARTPKTPKIQRAAQQAAQIEVINCDSVQVFRKLNIASAKASQELRQQLPHHLIDILNPDEKFTAGDFVRSCEQLIPQIHARQHIPIIAGGTIFYLKNFIYGLSPIPQTKGTFRSELEQLSPEDLQHKLQELDPDAKIHANDRQRQIRACEVSLETGRPFSSYKVPSQVRKDYQILSIVLERPRAELYQRIDQRVEVMFVAGLMDELEQLERAGYRNLQGIGYREFFLASPNLNSSLSQNLSQDVNQDLNLDQAPEKSMRKNPEKLLPAIQQNSRNYAKRQITFLKQIPGAYFYAPEDAEAIANRILEFTQR